MIIFLQCYKAQSKDGTYILRDCIDQKGETPLPESFHPLTLTVDQHEEWIRQVNASIAKAKEKEKA